MKKLIVICLLAITAACSSESGDDTAASPNRPGDDGSWCKDEYKSMIMEHFELKEELSVSWSMNSHSCHYESLEFPLGITMDTAEPQIAPWHVVVAAARDDVDTMTAEPKDTSPESTPYDNFSSDDTAGYYSATDVDYLGDNSHNYGANWDADLLVKYRGTGCTVFVHTSTESESPSALDRFAAPTQALASEFCEQ